MKKLILILLIATGLTACAQKEVKHFEPFKFYQEKVTVVINQQPTTYMLHFYCDNTTEDLNADYGGYNFNVYAMQYYHDSLVNKRYFSMTLTFDKYSSYKDLDLDELYTVYHSSYWEDFKREFLRAGLNGEWNDYQQNYILKIH